MSTDLEVPQSSARPRHVAIIMDGNGRWAQARFLPRLAGHRRGAQAVGDIVTYVGELEIPYLTLYSFSRQNWRGPVDEVSGLMVLLEDYCRKELPRLLKNGVRVCTIGDPRRLPKSTQEALRHLVEQTAMCRRLTLCLALDYGGREELVEATKRLATEAARGELQPEDIDEDALASRLYTATIPDPDLLIRTSGEVRLSNFLLWQLAYTELHFTEALWPEFTRAHFAKALWDYAGRERRYGRATTSLPAPFPSSSSSTSMPAVSAFWDKRV